MTGTDPPAEPASSAPAPTSGAATVPGPGRRPVVVALVVLAFVGASVAVALALSDRDGGSAEDRPSEVAAEQVERSSSTTTLATTTAPVAAPSTTAPATVPTTAAPTPTTADLSALPPAPGVDIGAPAGPPVDDAPVGVERPPADRAAAQAAIGATVSGLVDPALSPAQRRDLLTGGEPGVLDGLAGRLQAVAASACGGDARAAVGTVYFHAPTWATVTFTMEGSTVPQAGRGFLFGTTVVQGADGRWRSAADETTDFVDLVGPFCA